LARDDRRDVEKIGEIHKMGTAILLVEQKSAGALASAAAYVLEAAM